MVRDKACDSVTVVANLQCIIKEHYKASKNKRTRRKKLVVVVTANPG